LRARRPWYGRAGGWCRLPEPSREDAAARGITALYFVVVPNGEQLAGVTRRVEGGQLRPTIDKVFPLANARQAFERIQGAHGAGKIVLRVSDE
jgi:NADPH:quinone reductase-like Zn-dependent oxidoreductase